MLEMFQAAQRLALPAGGWDETTLFYRNQLQATQTAWKRADSHQSGARCVRRFYVAHDLPLEKDSTPNWQTYFMHFDLQQL